MKRNRLGKDSAGVDRPSFHIIKGLPPHRGGDEQQPVREDARSDIRVHPQVDRPA